MLAFRFEKYVVPTIFAVGYQFFGYYAAPKLPASVSGYLSPH